MATLDSIVRRSVPEAFIPKGASYNKYGAEVNLAYGGQGGYMPHIGFKGEDGKIYEELISNDGHVRKPAIILLLDYPRFFDLTNNPRQLIANLKACIETIPESVSGIKEGRNYSFDSHAVGKAGLQQSELTNVTIPESNPSFHYTERAGRAIMNFWKFYQDVGIASPETASKAPLIASQIESSELDTMLYTSEFTTFTILAIEPDLLFRKPIAAQILYGMKLDSSLEIDYSSDETASGELIKFDLSFKAIPQSGHAAMELAAKIMPTLPIYKIRPDYEQIAGIDGINPRIESISNGYARRDPYDGVINPI